MNFKFSGHETFTFRYAWLPKAHNIVAKSDKAFSDEDQAMVELGVGKNMVRSIRFWATYLGIINSDGGRSYSVTPFGEALLDPENGYDPYLEDSQTLWLLHWRLSTASEPIFAWHYLLNKWQESELITSNILPMMTRELEGVHKVSRNSLDGLLKIFYHTYVPTRGKKSKVNEDNLDCPLVQLRLVEHAGAKDESGSKKELIYVFRRGEKPEISNALFYYCLTDYWAIKYPDEMTLSYGQIASEEGSPGQIFKLSDADIQERLHAVDERNRHFQFTDSTSSRFLERKFTSFEKASGQMLGGIYK
jgi:hypothetical protein